MAWLAAMRLSVSSCFGAGRPNSPSGILDAPSTPNVRLPKSPPPVFEVLASSGATIAAGLPNTAFMLPLVDGGAELPNVLCPEDWGTVDGVLDSWSKSVGTSSAFTELTSRGLRVSASSAALDGSLMALDNPRG
jgi:hypothetical protein